MRRRIAFLHTSPVHVETFEQLTRAVDPSVEVEHLVAEDLLADAQHVGASDPALIARVHQAMAKAASGGASLVVCTCSTIGGSAERTPARGFAVARIDRAMADRAVELGPRILIAAAVESTVRPTRELVRESAAALRKDAKIEELLVPGAWPHFLRGDRAEYVAAVADAVRPAAARADVVVLAQASMAPAAELLKGLGVEVLSSPALGVESALARLNG